MPADAAEDDDTVRRSPLGRAVRDTQRAAVGASDRVDALRTELGARIDCLDAKVDDLGMCTARVEGAVGVLVDELRAAREVRVTATVARIEVEKTGEIAKVNEAVSVRADRRQLALKAIAVAGPLAAAALTWLFAQC